MYCLIRFALAIATLLVLLLSEVAPAQNRPFAFAVLGDYGCGCRDQQAVANSMISWHKKRPFDTVITTGDNIYGAPLYRTVLWWQKPRRGGNKYWFPSRFDRYYQPLLSRGVKFYASLGNHDLETNSGKDLIEDKKRFNVLKEEGYYSFTPETDPDDLVTFFALNTNTLAADPKQLEWFQEELSDSDSEWKIVYLHHPLYSSDGSHGSHPGLRKLLEPILVKSGVRVVFGGHNHFYARMKPQHGILHFVVGGGGRDLVRSRANKMTERVVSSHHFMYCELTPGRFEYWAVPPHGSILDHGSVVLDVQQ